LVTNPLEKFLGAYQFGTYNQTNPNDNYAFVRIEDLWQEDSNSDEDNDDPNTTDQTTDEDPIATTAQTAKSPTTNKSPTTTARLTRARKKPQWLVTDTYDDVAEKKIKALRQCIRKSNHKGFIIKQNPGEPSYRPAWRVVTVDLANSDPRLQHEGRYRVKKWRPKEEDATKRL
jgi:hypothetical protein